MSPRQADAAMRVMSPSWALTTDLRVNARLWPMGACSPVARRLEHVAFERVTDRERTRASCIWIVPSQPALMKALSSSMKSSADTSERWGLADIIHLPVMPS